MVLDPVRGEDAVDPERATGSKKKGAGGRKGEEVKERTGTLGRDRKRNSAVCPVGWAGRWWWREV